MSPKQQLKSSDPEPPQKKDLTKTSQQIRGEQTTSSKKHSKVGREIKEEPPTSPENTEEKGPKQVVRLTRHQKIKILDPIEQLFGESLVNSAGEYSSPTAFVTPDGIIGVYFGARWCPPCRYLFSSLMLLFEEARKAEHNLEMVFVSSDSSHVSFNEHLSKMTGWWAVDYSQEEKRKDLAVYFKIQGIPAFLLLDANTLEIINRDGRYFASRDPRGCDFPWRDMEPSTEHDLHAQQDLINKLLTEPEANSKELPNPNPKEINDPVNKDIPGKFDIPKTDTAPVGRETAQASRIPSKEDIKAEDNSLVETKTVDEEKVSEEDSLTARTS